MQQCRHIIANAQHSAEVKEAGEQTNQSATRSEIVAVVSVDWLKSSTQNVNNATPTTSWLRQKGVAISCLGTELRNGVGVWRIERVINFEPDEVTDSWAYVRFDFVRVTPS